MSWRWRPICLVALWTNFKYKSAINFHWPTFLNKNFFLDMKTHYLAILTLKNAPKYHLLSTKWHISSIIKPRQPIRRSIWSYWSHIWHLAWPLWVYSKNSEKKFHPNFGQRYLKSVWITSCGIKTHYLWVKTIMATFGTKIVHSALCIL